MFLTKFILFDPQVDVKKATQNNQSKRGRGSWYGYGGGRGGKLSRTCYSKSSGRKVKVSNSPYQEYIVLTFDRVARI